MKHLTLPATLAAGLFLLVATAILLPLSHPIAAADRPLLWGLVMAAQLVFFALAGKGINGRWAGILIDARNKISLSRFQMAGWTVVVLASTISAALCNIAEAGPATGTLAGGALGFSIDGNLLAAMGLASASLVGTPIILNASSGRPQPPETAQAAQNRMAATLGADAADMNAAGPVFGWSDASLARWSDMFRGDDTTGAHTVDLAKVQQFAVTLLLLGAWSSGMLDTLRQEGPITALPTFSQGFLWLLGVSHGSYLAAKAAPLAGAARPAPTSS